MFLKFVKATTNLCINKWYSWPTLRARYSCRVEGYLQTESVRVRPSVCPLLSYSTTALYRYSSNYTLSACLHSCNAWRTTPFILIRLTPQNLLQTNNLLSYSCRGYISSSWVEQWKCVEKIWLSRVWYKRSSWE